ncbi:RagB/SusD family nutrient uptake outer membrane protein [Agriterribacter sp.]|uniref:RagB/SusD family nutrient uptake outer membrane protein n=1 Tax=Agriterribacter sp. TaxID=2821509 RepID=UPI002B6A0FBC|nr:RagB/SusD family nutrient uptake outer membrane protein [Agriterribacter sp.]HTN06172.1 RagB/SusD family nutrient uptake outer membrane protein [Agriterribacter sp.]
MNPIKYIILIIFLTFAGCKVDRLPETELSDPSFWKSESDLKSATNYLYTFLPTLPVASDIWSDDAFGAVANNISDGTRSAPSSSTDYSLPYKLIRAANVIIEKAPRILQSGVSEDRINIYIGEARFFRAWAYFQLVQKYGGVPLILKPLLENAPELTAAAASREQVYQAIYDDLDFANGKLPTPTILGTNDYGRISNTAALSLKARVALFEGTRSKFHAYSNASEHLRIAIEAAKSVMDSKEHSLFGSYFNLFQPEGDGRQNKENILVKQYGVSITNNVLSHNSANDIENGAANPTRALIDSYLMEDGLPINKSPLYHTPSNTVEVFNDRDLRLGNTIMKRGDPFVPGRPVFDVADLSRQRTGFMSRKFFNYNDHESRRGFMDFPIIRYAEILLIFAEAKYELTESITDDDLNESINLLRSRAGLPALNNNFITTNLLDMRMEIRRERRVELAMEGFRYWDLIRWKTAETELPKEVVGNYFFSEFGTAVSPMLTPDNYILLQKADSRSFNPNRDYLWPLPVVELALNPSLIQNQEW